MTTLFIQNVHLALVSFASSSGHISSLIFSFYLNPCCFIQHSGNFQASKPHLFIDPPAQCPFWYHGISASNHVANICWDRSRQIPGFISNVFDESYYKIQTFETECFVMSSPNSLETSNLPKQHTQKTKPHYNITVMKIVKCQQALVVCYVVFGMQRQWEAERGSEGGSERQWSL